MRSVCRILFACVMFATMALAQNEHRLPPKVWDERAMADWPTPLAGLDARPTDISAKEYYSLRVDNLRTYPVYFPGHEPDGYWKMLQQVGPQPMIEPGQLKTEADWIEAGRTVFEQADQIHLRTFDPDFIARARAVENYKDRRPLPDGTVADVRWVPTERGVALGFRNCSACHIAYLEDGTAIAGAPTRPPVTSGSGLFTAAQSANRVVLGNPPFIMGSEPFGLWLYQAWGVPWREGDIHERLKNISLAEYDRLRRNFTRSGSIPRWNGSIFYPAKTPDLIGIKDRKYIDHTATHLHRGIQDLMRYAALVSFAEAVDFGSYHLIREGTKRAGARLPDAALYALALYIYSLKPPPNPNRSDAKSKAGERIFQREGCAMCHTPPLYTSNKLTLAKGFDPPHDVPATLDVLPISVGTDPGLALMTRKGTGYYKVPSLKGVWYRGRYLHDGSVASLEEMFDPDRLRETHVPGGWMPEGAKSHAIQGHEFGLKLEPNERKQLIAFLRTL